MLSFLILLTCFSLSTPKPKGGEALHEFHVSKCLVELNERDQAVQISLHIFLDDLEEALRRRGADKLQLCTPKEAADAEAHLQRYLKEQFVLRLNGKRAEYQFLGKEISDDLAAVWCYLEIPANPAALRELSITSRLLTEVFEDQKNIISVTGPNKKQGMLLLQKGKETETLTF